VVLILKLTTPVVYSIILLLIPVHVRIHITSYIQSTEILTFQSLSK